MKIQRSSTHRWSLLLSSGIALLASGNTLAVTMHDLRDSHLQPIYGTYAPQGNCQSEPCIVLDDSGFTYRYQGKATRPWTFEWAVSYGGPEYQGISHWFFPFVLNENDFGRVLITVNPEEKAGILAVEPNLGPGQSLTSLQAALVRHSPYVRCKDSVPAKAPAEASKP